MAELNSNAGTEDDWLPTRASLIERLQRQADASAWNRGWREFYASYYPVIVRFACRRGLPMAEADDLAQEVLLGIARKIEGFKYDPEVCQFKTWLFRIASNQITDRLRRLKRREKLGERHNQPLDALEGVADPGAVGPDDACGRVFDLELLNAALELVAHRVKPMNMRLFV